MMFFLSLITYQKNQLNSFVLHLTAVFSHNSHEAETQKICLHKVTIFVTSSNFSFIVAARHLLRKR